MDEPIRKITPFHLAFKDMARRVHETAVDKGWWDSDRSNGEAIALMHSELSEALEADRDGNPPDKHCPDHSSVAVEFADTIIRIMDYAHARGLDVAGAIEAKAAVNENRPHKHGGKRY
jgi:NTP pyrophosphatase (non-canonical NTP hydrolase)